MGSHHAAARGRGGPCGWVVSLPAPTGLRRRVKKAGEIPVDQRRWRDKQRILLRQCDGDGHRSHHLAVLCPAGDARYPPGGDFIAAIYSPYTTYGVDEVSRYDTFYGDYGVDNRRHSPQYRNFEEAKDLLTNIVNNGEDGPAARNSVRDAGARNPVLEASRPQASSPGLDPASLIN